WVRHGVPWREQVRLLIPACESNITYLRATRERLDHHLPHLDAVAHLSCPAADGPRPPVSAPRRAPAAGGHGRPCARTWAVPACRTARSDRGPGPPRTPWWRPRSSRTCPRTTAPASGTGRPPPTRRDRSRHPRCPARRG